MQDPIISVAYWAAAFNPAIDPSAIGAARQAFIPINQFTFKVGRPGCEEEDHKFLLMKRECAFIQEGADKTPMGAHIGPVLMNNGLRNSALSKGPWFSGNIFKAARDNNGDLQPVHSVEHDGVRGFVMPDGRDVKYSQLWHLPLNSNALRHDHEEQGMIFGQKAPRQYLTWAKKRTKPGTHHVLDIATPNGQDMWDLKEGYWGQSPFRSCIKWPVMAVHSLTKPVFRLEEFIDELLHLESRDAEDGEGFYTALVKAAGNGVVTSVTSDHSGVWVIIRYGEELETVEHMFPTGVLSLVRKGQSVDVNTALVDLNLNASYGPTLWREAITERSLTVEITEDHANIAAGSSVTIDGMEWLRQHVISTFCKEGTDSAGRVEYTTDARLVGERPAQFTMSVENRPIKGKYRGPASGLILDLPVLKADLLWTPKWNPDTAQMQPKPLLRNRPHYSDVLGTPVLAPENMV